MPICRFENRIQATALALEGHVDSLQARSPKQVIPVLNQIARYQANGYWAALLIEYELGHWLGNLPGKSALALPPSADHSPRLVAHIFRRARRTRPWQPLADDRAQILKITPAISQARYFDDIASILERIASGDVYQVNYTFNMQVEISGHAQALYRRIAHHHPCAHAAYIEDDQRTVLCFSPELFIQRSGHTLTCRPMKGTAPRHPDPARDAALANALQESRKNRAENLMIVDLMRNDLSRIAMPGSVEVPHLFTLETYPSVFALTSTITAQLPGGTGLYALLQALFPCGSITGAPKIAAMRQIHALESRPRNLYCGSLGWLAPGGDFSFNIAIRTLVLHDQQHGDYGVGSGIVHDSIARKEWQECFWKARQLQN